jgi:hypothetical protein
MGGSVVGVAGDVGIGGDVSIGGTQTGEAGAPVTGMTCMSPADCDVSSLCKTATCSDGLCAEHDAPDGPIQQQVPGDCKQAACEGGKEVLLVDTNDKDDHAECTTDSCDVNGKPTHTPRTGATCGNGGLCGPDGKCGTCNDQACPVPGTCQVSYCAEGQCKTTWAPAATLCPGTPTDYGQCDGQGNCVDCVNSGGCDEASTCGSDNQCIPA